MLHSGGRKVGLCELDWHMLRIEGWSL